MSKVQIVTAQSLLSVACNDSGATLSVEDLPSSVGTTIRFEVHSLEGQKGALRQAPHVCFQDLRSQSTGEITNYLKRIFSAMDWLKPGVLKPIDPSRVHPAPPDGEKWSGYFVNLLMPRGSSDPHLSVHFVQQHKIDVPALSAEMLVSIISQMFHFATDPSAKAEGN